MMASFYYYDQNRLPTIIKYERKNENNSGRSGKLTPSCKWPIFSISVALFFYRMNELYESEHDLRGRMNNQSG